MVSKLNGQDEVPLICLFPTDRAIGRRAHPTIATMHAHSLQYCASRTPRYVYEVMGVLVSGGVVEMCEGSSEEGGEEFSLPQSRAEGLKRMGVYFEELPILHACAFEAVCEDARKGNGVPHEQYVAFHGWMGGQSQAKHERLLVHTLVPSIDGGRVKAALDAGGCEVAPPARLIVARR